MLNCNILYLKENNILTNEPLWLTKPWQASLNKAPSQGGKEEQRERTQVRTRSTTTQSESQMKQRNKLCSKAPPVTRSTSGKERETWRKIEIRGFRGKLSSLKSFDYCLSQKTKEGKKKPGKTKIPNRKKVSSLLILQEKRKRKNVKWKWKKN
jgi:hypothetical protein